MIGSESRRRSAVRGSRAVSAVALLLLGAVAPLGAQQTPPPGGPPKSFELPRTQSFSLANGLRVTLVPYGETPKVFAELVIRAGNVDEGADQVWLADITVDLMQEGTENRSAEEIAREAAGMGGSLNAGVGSNLTSVSGSVLSEFGPDIVELIADVVQHPLFPADELDRLKADRVRQLSISLQSPQAVTLAEFRKRMYPDQPYGRVFPTADMIQGYTVEQIRTFWDDHFGAASAHLYVAGRFDGDAVRRAVEDAFADWKSGTETEPALAEQQRGREVVLVDRPGAPQSTIYLGLPVIDPSNQDFVALQVVNMLLGGASTSRITSNIREDKGYTYSPVSQISSRYRDAYWVETADVTTDVTGAALDQIFAEIERLRSEPPSEEELEGIENYMAGIFVLQNSSREGIVSQLEYIDLHGLPDDYLATYVDRVHAVTPARVQELAVEYLDPQQMLLVVTGDPASVRGQLAPFGEVQEVSPNG